MKKHLMPSTAALALLLVAGVAQASGTVSRPSPTPTLPTTSQASSGDSYARGKDIYMKRIACDGCAVAGGVQSKNDAMSLISRIDAGEFQLKRGEKRHVKAYLKNRFEIK